MITDAFQVPHHEQSARLSALALNLTLTPCIGEQEVVERARVVLVMMSEQQLDPIEVSLQLRRAVAEHKGGRLPAHPDTPVLGEVMQRSSWRLATQGAEGAHLRSMHTTQTEMWLRGETGEAFPVLCQVFAADRARLDRFLNAASTFRWEPTLREAA